MIEFIEGIYFGFEQFTQTELFRNFAPIFISGIASLPGFTFLPNELFTVPAYVFGLHPAIIILAVGIGGFIGDSVMFLAAKHIHKKISGSTQKKVTKMVYRHKHWIFFVSPSAFMGISDIIIIVAALKKFHYPSFAPFLFAGNLFRGFWGMMLVIYGVSLFDWLL